MMEEKQRLHPDAKTGLTSQQVASQKEKGLKNEATEKISKSTGQIIKDIAMPWQSPATACEAGQGRSA